jgi:hypothetical protein
MYSSLRRWYSYTGHLDLPLTVMEEEMRTYTFVALGLAATLDFSSELVS